LRQRRETLLRRVEGLKNRLRERQATGPRIPELRKGVEQAIRRRGPGLVMLLNLVLPRRECAAQTVEGQHQDKKR
jgi:hypothetical protein